MDILLIAEYALSEIGGYDVLMCESGAQALGQIEDYSPDLIILDVMMPDMDGPETLSAIRQNALFKATPALFITAKIFPSEVDYLKSYDEGVIGVIPKPYDPTTISDSIQSIWDTHFLDDNNSNKVLT